MVNGNSMSVSDGIQAAATGLVALALLLNVLQLREVARQSRALDNSMRNASYNALPGSKDDPRVTFFLDDPELLAWHLESRGFEVSTPHENKRRLYVLAKLNVHEANFVNHNARTLSDEHWQAWAQVISDDFAIPEFQEVWRKAKDLYSAPFVTYIDGHVAASTTETGATDGANEPAT